DRPDDAEVDDRDDRDLGVGDPRERVPDLLGRYHVAPDGALRRTLVISSQSSRSSSVCRPRVIGSTSASSKPSRSRTRSPQIGRLVEVGTSDRPRPLEPPQLYEGGGAVLLGPPVEGELVRRRAELPRCELVQRPRVSDLVLRDRREGDILLEARRDPGPLG